MIRWLCIGWLAATALGAPACDTADDDDGDVADVAADTDRPGDGNWEDGDALEIRDHWDP
ncbi:MAG: hypothetical protein GYA57_08120 [Myxococcales bacterium]|nr:hypothetical protein [Myxococcales bacterium]